MSHRGEDAMIDDNSEGLKRIRSPAYPALNLKTAIEKAYDFYKAEGRNTAALPVTLEHWGYSKRSGSGLKALAALKSFGLIEVTGSGDSQRVKLSDLALRIILDDREDSPDRAKAVAAAVLQPKIHKKLWNLWGSEMPSHGNIRHHLIFDEKFNEHFVDDFIKEYKSSIDYANVRHLTAGEQLSMSSVDEDQHEIKSLSDINMAPAKQAYSPPSPGHEIAKFPVGKHCTISLFANGDYTKKSIEALVAQLTLNLELGVFDDLQSPSGDASQPTAEDV
jgi:hypothetical protein